MGMHVAARPDVVEAPLERWREVGRLVLDRRTRLGLGQEELALRTDRLASRSIVTTLERATKTSYKRRSLIGVARGLGWNDDAIENFLADGTAPEEQRQHNAVEAGDELADMQAIAEELTVMRQENETIRALLERVARHLGLGSVL